MNLLKTKITYGLFIAAALVTCTISVQAQTCPRGSLSKQFCDRDGDMMADAPSEPKKWQDPYTLVFGHTPNQSFVFYDGAKESLMRHIEKITGKKVVFFPYQTNAAQLEAMRSGMLHIAGLNTGSVPTAVNCGGFHLFAMTAKHNDEYGYKMQIITYPGSGITNIRDLRGQTILFTSSSSNSGHKAPVAILKKQFGMEDDIDYKSRFSGKHSKSIQKIANREYKIAAIANGIRQGMISQGKISKNATKVIYASDSFPTTGYGYTHTLSPKLASKIEEAFKTFRWTESNSSTQKPFNKFGEDHFIDADYKKKWKIIRDIDRANDIAYECL